MKTNTMVYFISQEMGTAREIVNRVQKMRKKAGLQASDPVAIFIDVPPTNGTLGLSGSPRLLSLSSPRLEHGLARIPIASQQAAGCPLSLISIYRRAKRCVHGWLRGTLCMAQAAPQTVQKPSQPCWSRRATTSGAPQPCPGTACHASRLWRASWLAHDDRL